MNEEQSWKFIYRVYEKQRAIQFKPFHDKHNHFSIIWFNKKPSLEIFRQIEAEIKQFLITKEWKLTFTILRACTNCTYGRFDQEFENLILDLRKRYQDICQKKDLPLDDPRHEDLHDKILKNGNIQSWNTSNPIIHHVHGKSNTEDPELNKQWETIFRGPDRVENISDGKLFGNYVLISLEN